MDRLEEDLKVANEKTPQHALNELANQILFLECLHLLCESKKLKKCILSVHFLFMTSEHRKHVLNYFGLGSENTDQCDTTEPIIWLRLSILPFYGECLADKGFKNTDRFFAYLNKVR